MALRRPAREDLRERRGVEGQARGEYYEELRGRGGCLGKGCTTTSEGEYLSSHSRVPLLCCSNGTNSRVTHTHKPFWLKPSRFEAQGLSQEVLWMARCPFPPG